MLPNRCDSHLFGRLFVTYELVKVSRTLENKEDEMNCANYCVGKYVSCDLWAEAHAGACL